MVQAASQEAEPDEYARLDEITDVNRAIREILDDPVQLDLVLDSARNAGASVLQNTIDGYHQPKETKDTA
jgi:hypothetical protein